MTPVYNGAAFIDDALASVVAQTYDNWECIVVDNASTDETASIVEKRAHSEPRIRLVQQSSLVSIYENHNRGLREVSPRSAYIKVLHADDWLGGDCLARMVDVAERHRSVGVVGAHRMYGDARDLAVLPTDREVFDGRRILRQSLRGGPYVTGSPSSLLLRADLVRANQPFYDESLWHSDTEAIYRALRLSDLGFVHDVLTFTRLHPDANTPFSNEMKTYAPENLLMLFRHGPAVLRRSVYLRQLWKELVLYSWFLIKQLLKPSRHRDPRFRSFHLGALARVRREPASRSFAPVLSFLVAIVSLQGRLLPERTYHSTP